jgi:uncharacterized protein (TIGR02231 family)
MKFISLLVLLVFCQSMSSQTLKTIRPKPVKAIVYISGAEIAYLESLTLPAGTSQIIIEGVSPGLDENSISAYFKGGLVIDTKKGLRYPELPRQDKPDHKYLYIIDRISDSLDELSFLVKDCNNKFSAFEKEKSLLLNNRLIKGQFTKDSIALLKESLDLLRTRMSNIDEQELLIERKLAKYTKLVGRLNERKSYYELLQENNTSTTTETYEPVHQVIVTIEAEQPVTGNLSLKYYVSSAGWIPMYDIQASSGKDKIHMVYRAQVYQNTGIDWKDVSLILSTSNPTIGNTKPVMTAWNLYYGYPQGYVEQMNKKAKAPSFSYNNMNQYQGRLEEDKVTLKDDASDAGEMEIPEPLFTVSDNLMRTEYEIKTRYSIQSDNKAHNVIINNMDIPVSLAYLSVPKLDKDAFLMGKVANWEDLNLLPATAKIYFDESYIGTTVVDPSTTKDTLYMNLGRDRSVIVKRTVVKDKSREQVVGEYRVVTKTIEITVRNTKGIPLQFEVEDQIPVTTDNTIRIVMGDNSDASYNEVSGKLVWKMDIKSKDTKKVTFTYEVRYPKDKVLAGL